MQTINHKVKMAKRVIIVGGGIAGLTAANIFHKKGWDFLLLEAEGRVGGRVKTDLVDGFRMDHGFQVLLTSYPETQNLLDYSELKLRKFPSGARIFNTNKWSLLADPIRNPALLAPSILSQSASLGDKFKTLSLRNKVMGKSIDQIFSGEEKSTLEFLKEMGFSEKILQNFFKPFLGGIFLENELDTSNRMFQFVYKMFAEGYAAVPALGMEEIPHQLVKKLPKEKVLVNKVVTQIDNGQVSCSDGSEYQGDMVLLATEAMGLVTQYANKVNHEHKSVTNLYFKAKNSPSSSGMLMLNATPGALVNNVACMSDVAPAYAPKGRSLVSVSINGYRNEKDHEIVELIKKELIAMFGIEVNDWELIRVYRIHYALPKQDHVKNILEAGASKINDKLYFTGDHLLNGSINGAMKAGRLVAETMVIHG